MELLLSYLNSIHELSPPLREHLMQVLRQRSLPKKEFLLKAGHVSRYIYFIEKGIFRCFYIRHNQEICSWFMKEGDVIVSVESFFTQKESYESIQALEDCKVHYISYDDLQYIYRQYPEFNYTGRVLLEKYYTLSEQRLYSIRMMRSQERYDYFVNHFPDLYMRVSARHLSSYLGITEVTLSKIKGKRYSHYPNDGI